MNILETKFEAINVVLQDTTGWEENRTFRDTNFIEIEPTIPKGYLKEIHLINPIKKIKIPKRLTYSVKCKGCKKRMIYWAKDIMHGHLPGESMIECKDCKTLITVEDMP